MIFGSTNVLGLAVADRAVVCAELSVSGGRRAVRRAATFTLPEELSLDKPDALGQALTSFLRQHGFSASRAVVGVPAKWLIAVEKEVPPAEDEQLVAMLRLQAERMSTLENSQLVFDYARDRQIGRAAGKVLMVGILRRQLERVQQAMESAGLTVQAITSTALALAWTTVAGDADASLVILAGHGAEIVWRQHGVPRMLRHVSLAAANGQEPVALGALLAELRRSVALTAAAAPNGPMPTAGSGQGALLLWDLLGLSVEQIGELSSRLSVAVHQVATTSLGLEMAAGVDGRGKPSASPARFAPAMALALAGADGALPLDLAHSRLAPLPQRRVGRRTAWTIAVCAALLLGIIGLWIAVLHRESHHAAIRSRLGQIADDVKSAEKLIARLKYARGFFDARTPALECLRELTLAFRDDEQIYVTSFSLNEQCTGQITGRSADQRFVLSVLDRLKRNPRFPKASLMDMRDAGGRSREVMFSMSFSYTAVE